MTFASYKQLNLYGFSDVLKLFGNLPGTSIIAQVWASWNMGLDKWAKMAYLL